MKKINLGFSLALAICISGCTAISVEPASGEHGIKHVCINKNKKVIRSDFLPTLERGFQRHGISTETYEGNAPSSCKFLVTYTATQGWDLGMVLKDAEVWIWEKKSGGQIAYGNYHLRGGGGFSLMKWQGAEKKIRPMLDQLLVEYK